MTEQQKAGRPAGNRVSVTWRICPDLLERFGDLAHKLGKSGRTRPELVEEAITDLLAKHGG